LPLLIQINVPQKEELQPKKIGKTPREIQKSLRKNYRVEKAHDYILRGKCKKYPFSRKTLRDEELNEEWAYPENYVKGFLPELGEVVWQADNFSHLYAYIYLNKQGQKIGYIYLPTFHFPDDELEDRVLGDLIDILRMFNKESAALVFDITDNPGGSDYFMNTLLSMFSSKPIKTFLESEIITQRDIYYAIANKKGLESFKEEDYEEEDLSPKVVDGLITYLSNLIDSFNAGKRLSDPWYLNGVEEIEPSEYVQYKHPIIVLVNELDFSCGDFFPAMMQDNGLAKIFGTKTAGAGGYVLSYSANSSFGLAGYSLTGSVGLRANGTPLENVGVTPDIPYKMTVKDLQSNFINYIEAVNKEVDLLLKKKPVSV